MSGAYISTVSVDKGLNDLITFLYMHATSKSGALYMYRYCKILFHLKVESIEKIRAKRKTVRSASTKFVNKVKSFLETFDSQNETHQEHHLEYLLNLDAKQIELQTLNKEVEDLLSDKELFEAEIESSLEYEESINDVRYKIKSKINKIHLSQPVVNSKGANESNHNHLFCPKTKSETPFLNNEIEIPEIRNVENSETETQVKEIVMSSVLNPSCSPKNYATLLQTVEVQVINDCNKVMARLLFDSGSQKSFIQSDEGGSQRQTVVLLKKKTTGKRLQGNVGVFWVLSTKLLTTDEALQLCTKRTR
ncbi:uncharacterized protein TNCV_2589951 [Trichonephila clavipes]|nr:uncharacterized protein TNCV_2589951 [Trichonephila clavipes]